MGRRAWNRRMNRRNRGRKGGKYTIERALRRLDRTADQLLRSNKECLIPDKEAVGHDKMNNCHIVAVGFLDLISNKRGEVLCWPISTRSIGRIAQRAIVQGQYETDPLAIVVERYEPTPRSKNHKDCKFTYACRNHDDRVFKPTDSVARVNLEDKETLFKIGFRTVAAYTAWYRGHQKWSQEEFKKDSYIQDVIKDYPFLQPAFDRIGEWGTREIAAAGKLEEEMKRWQNAYLQSAWHQAKSEISVVAPALRIAATGVPSSWGYPVAMTILPQESGECLLVATVLENDNPIAWFTRRMQRVAAKRVATEWATRLEELKPNIWLPMLAQLCSFLYVSPDDYYNEEIVTGDERREIERAMSKQTSPIKI